MDVLIMQKVKKIFQQVLAIAIIGVSVWVQPESVLRQHPTEYMRDKAYGRFHLFASVSQQPIQVFDPTGNCFEMRQLKGGQYLPFLKEGKQVAVILICREYRYAGEQWYEWCTEESGQWVLYR